MIDTKPRKSWRGWTEAQSHLRQDPVLARIIQRVGDCTYAPRKDYFGALCQSIISQQISTSVAAAIHKRFKSQFPRLRPSANALLLLEEEALRACGLSRQKTAYLRSLAEAFTSDLVPTRRLRFLDDEEIISRLTQIKGIGRWTAEIFLMFVLNRPDVLPADDLGIRKAVQAAYGIKTYPTKAQVIEIAEPWRPYRSVASWYLWKSGLQNFYKTPGDRDGENKKAKK